MISDPRIGIDLGGSTLRIGLFDGAVAISSSRIALALPTPSFVVEHIATTCHQMRQQAHIAESTLLPLGLGIAAMLQGGTGIVSNAPNLRWIDVDVKSMLEQGLGASYHIIIENDVNAIAWGEFRYGAGIGVRDTLTVCFGTGIGAGVISNGRLVQGAVCAGELGHTKIAWDAAAIPCACGSRGCIEAYAGGAALQSRIRRELAQGVSIATVAHAGGIELATPAHVDQAAQAGDEWALSLWTEMATIIAVTLGNALAVLGSEVLVIGGGMMSRTPLLLEQTIIAVELVAPPVILQRLRIVPASLGDAAGPLGAADLASRSATGE
jgi:glucokinase